MDEKRRNIEQEALAHSWAEKGAALRDAPRINIADAMAWQRDAAKAGAPLSREPLAGLKTALADRVKAIEDLQHQSQVQREAAVLLAQRIEVLSTKPWQDAQAQREALQADLDRWHAQAKSLTDDAQWSSVDAKFPPALQTSAQQLQAVWLAFGDALQLTEAAAADPQAPLPAVPAWAEQIRQVRNPSQTQAPVQTVEPSLNASTGPAIGVASEATRKVKPLGDKVLIDQQRLELAMQAEALFKPVSNKSKDKASHKAEEVPSGATEEVTGAITDELSSGVAQEAPTDATPPDAPAIATESNQSSESEIVATTHTNPVTTEPALVPAMGGRKMQETLRNLREEWKKVDKQAAPNPALWKRFDAACNKAHVVVDAWLKEARAQTAANKAQRLALIEELKTWAAEHAQGPDWKGVARQLHQFAQRWRESGHLSEKMFAELQPQWKAAIHAAHEPLEAVQKASLERRNALIAEAQALGAAPTLRIDAVKALQQRWQEEAHAVVLDRRLEQKLWDAFRKPIDEAFARKSTVREQAQAALTPIDKAVMEASKAVESAVAKGDASAIRAAMQNLEKVSRGELPTAEPSPVVVAAVASAPAPAPAPEEPSVATATEVLAEPVEIEESKVASEPAQEISQDASSSSESLQETQSGLATETPTETPTEAAPEITPEVATDLPVESVAPTPTPKAAPRPVVAVRGDDRPGQKRTELPSQGSRGRDGKPGGKGAIGGKAGGKFSDKPGGGWRDREDSAPRGPRLGEAAFRAQRFAIDNAQDALRRLAAQAHGEVLTQLLHAWEKRDPEQMPAAQAIGNKLNAAQRTQWTQALGKAPAADATQALLRMEMAADLPTPAAHMDARRALQLQLLTRRNDPSPQMTWAADAAQVLSSGYDEANGRRLQSALKVLLKR